MDYDRFVKKFTIIFMYIMILLAGKTIEYLSTFQCFIDLADAINFSVNTFVIIVNIIFYSVFLFLCSVFFRKGLFSNETWSVNVLNRKQVQLIVILFVVFIGYTLIINNNSAPLGKKIYKSNLAVLLEFCVVVVLGPISEEIFFRKILIDYFESVYHYSAKKVILLQSVLFYIPHFINGNITFIIFYVGIISGIMYYYSKSIIYSILLHVLCNISALIFIANIIHVKMIFPWYIIGISFISVFVIVFVILREFIAISKSRKTIA